MTLPMATRILALLTLLATAALMGDTAQVLCFGEDGHAALERLVSDEHLGTVATMHDETLLPTRHASPDGVHVDVSVGDAGVKGRTLASVLPAAKSSHTPLGAGDPPLFVHSVPVVEAPTLCALRTTVLRT